MPLIDKPLHELYEYKGVNPRPEDFEKFWDEALATMHSTDSRVALRLAKFSAPRVECFDLFFNGVGGSRVHAKYLRPKETRGKHRAVLQFHGYSGDSGDWQEKLGYVTSLDCCVA